MITFYVCRHGQTLNNKIGKFAGHIDTPLTEEGIENAHSTARKLAGVHIDSIISSDLGRAFATAYIISRDIGYTDEIQRTASLREINYGELAHKTYDAYPEITPEKNTNFVAPGGESLAQMQARVLTWIADFANANSGEMSVLLVAHDGTINAINAAYLGQSIGRVDADSHNAHDFVARFKYDSGAFTEFVPLT